MEIQEKLYCRFCAEQKSANQLFDLEKDSQKCEEINQKLGLIKAVVVDVCSENMLPKTVCFVCSDSLNQTSDFIDKLKAAQSILIDLFPKNKHPYIGATDDDNSHGFDDLPSPNQEKDPDLVQIKEEEDMPLHTYKQNMEKLKGLIKADNKESYKFPLFPVKLEPKEEPDIKPDDTVPQYSVLNNQNFDPSINVQALIDAAIGDIPFTPNQAVYATQVPMKPKKKSIKFWKDYPWVCVQCDHSFPDVQMLRTHFREVHKVCASFACVDCSETRRCYDFEVFVKHARKHWKSLRHICHYCDIKTENLQTHLNTHFPDSQTACPACGDILDNEEELLTHTREYAVKKRKPRRKQGTPITTDELTCDICSKVYKSLNSLRDHRKLHTSDRKRNYTCERCGKTFFSKGGLTTHIMTHDNIRPHTCKICNRSFSFPNMLRRHVEMHSNIKPYSCEQCGRTFRLQYQLNSHMIVHSDSMPFVCQYCSKAFRYKQILRSHERQHTGVKPYSCRTCTMEFTNWSNYNKHMKRRHNTDTSKKRITPEGVFPVNPETGQLIQIEDPVGTEIWKKQIMLPVKRGKKKIVKQQDANS